MCSRVECPTCHKPTWAGCGRHIEQALAGVPQDKRCKCRETASKGPASKATESAPSKGFFSFFGK